MKVFDRVSAKETILPFQSHDHNEHQTKYISCFNDFLSFSLLQPTSPKFGKADSYEKLEKLGEGSYATVYKGKSK